MPTFISLFAGEELSVLVNAALPALREATENCPACILAALRQRGIPVPSVNGFNFTEEMKSVWSDINQELDGR